MGVDTGQYVNWYRIYRFRQIIPKTFVSEIDTRSICSDIVSLASVVVVVELSLVCKVKEAK